MSEKVSLRKELPVAGETPMPPGSGPTARLTGRPAGVRSGQPAGVLSGQPTGVLSEQPAGVLSEQPAGVLSEQPAGRPIVAPNGGPTGLAGEPLFGRRWTGPAGPAPRAVFGAAAVSGLAAAVAVPEGPPGLGFLVATELAVAAVLVVRWRAGARPAEVAPLPVGRPEIGWTAAALALSAVGAVRAAEWLAALCLLAALVAAGLAVAGRSFRGVTTALAAAGLAVPRAVPWLARRLRGCGLGGPLRTALAGLVGLALLAVFGSLLAAADVAFAQLLDGVLPRVDTDVATRWTVLFGAGALAAAGACFLVLAPPDPAALPAARPTRLRCLDWALPTGLLVGLFGLFVGVQSVVLFGGAEHVLRTAGLTYAEYARSGFWQLLAVTALALGVLAAGSRWAPAGTATERGVKRGLLATLAGLTLVIVASAIGRMWLYQQAYGFTVLRLVVLTCELWLGAGFLVVLVAVLRLRPAGLTRPLVAAGLAALLGLAALDPERFVAEHNVARWAESGRIDTDYLGQLSADAAPALDGLPEPMRSCTLAAIAAGTPETADWRSRNLSRAVNHDRLAAAACPGGGPG